MGFREEPLTASNGEEANKHLTVVNLLLLLLNEIIMYIIIADIIMDILYLYFQELTI